MNIAICTRATMYNHPRMYVNQIIYNYWIRMQEGIVEKILRSGKPVNLTGDGQFDSPGFSARFLFYTMIDSTTKLVVDFYVAEKTMVSSTVFTVHYQSDSGPYGTCLILWYTFFARIRITTFLMMREDILCSFQLNNLLVYFCNKKNLQLESVSGTHIHILNVYLSPCPNAAFLTFSFHIFIGFEVQFP
jgi:hypothetical protein